MTNSVVCTNCRFFVSNNDDSGMGQCRRFPPVPMLAPQQASILNANQTLGVMAVSPPVGPEYSCGEWAERLATDPALIQIGDGEHRQDDE